MLDRYLLKDRGQSAVAILGPQSEKTMNNPDWRIIGDIDETLLHNGD